MFVHGDNIAQKENNQTKYTDKESIEYIKEIRANYDIWKQKNLALKGPFLKPQEIDADIINERVALLNQYKDFIDKKEYAEKFDSRSNLHSTVLEEFICYLFNDIVREISETALFGKAHSFKDLFFLPGNFIDMVKRPCAKIEQKDHDFVIGVKIGTTMICEGEEDGDSCVIQVPAVAIECKTYLDKTMLEGSSTSSSQLKTRNPNALYIVVSEWLKLTESINLNKYQVDQVYVLRKQRNTDREYRYSPDYVKNPIYSDVVMHLFNYVRHHLTADWENGISYGLEKGYLL